MYKISLILKSFDLDSLARAEEYLLSMLSFFGVDKIKHQFKPRKCKKITVLRSPHIDKKSREQFQLISHKKTLVFKLYEIKFVLLVLNICKHIKLNGIELEFFVEFSTF